MQDLAAQGIVEFAQGTGYFILFLLMIIEGPIVTVAAAFAASLGLFNIYFIFPLSLAGNIIGDLVYFFLGRIARHSFTDKYLKKFKISEERIRKLEEMLKKNPGKALAIIKIIPPLPTPGLLMAGAMRMKFTSFFFYSLIISIGFSLAATLLGFYSGVALGRFQTYVTQVENLVLVSFSIFIFFQLIKKIHSERIVILIFVALQLLAILRNLSIADYHSFFWFCDFAPLLFIFALLLKNHQLLKATLNICLFLQVISLYALSAAVFFHIDIFGFIDILNYAPSYIAISFLLHLSALIAFSFSYKTRPAPSALIYSTIILGLTFIASNLLVPINENINYITSIADYTLPYHNQLWIFFSFMIIVLPTHIFQVLIWRLRTVVDIDQ